MRKKYVNKNKLVILAQMYTLNNELKNTEDENIDRKRYLRRELNDLREDLRKIES